MDVKEDLKKLRGRVAGYGDNISSRAMDAYKNIQQKLPDKAKERIMKIEAALSSGKDITATVRGNYANLSDKVRQQIDRAKGLSKKAEKPVDVEAAKSQIRREIDEHIGLAAVPEFIKEFLQGQWSKLMLKIYVKEGVKSKAWLESLNVMDELIECTNSALRKSVSDEKLVNLVKRLKYGMTLIPVTPAFRDKFIKAIVTYVKQLDARNKQPKKPAASGGAPAAGGQRLFMDELLVDNKDNI